MNACLLRSCLLGCILIPGLIAAQTDSHPTQTDSHPATYTEATTISGNVPLNEINTRAYRHFHKLFPAAENGEYWFKSIDGYRYSLTWYPGKEIPRMPGDLIKLKFSDYSMDVVTEITDGSHVIYLVK